MTTFGENLKLYREKARLEQDALAALMNYANNSAISRWENTDPGEVPKAAVIEQFAKALKCQPWQLLKGVRTQWDVLRTPAVDRYLDQLERDLEAAIEQTGLKNSGSHIGSVADDIAYVEGDPHVTNPLPALAERRAERARQLEPKQLAAQLSESAALVQRVADALLSGQLAAPRHSPAPGASRAGRPRRRGRADGSPKKR